MRLEAINIGLPLTVGTAAEPHDTVIVETSIDRPAGLTAAVVDGDATARARAEYVGGRRSE